MRAIGMMSGTSMDGVDATLIETDGLGHVAPVAGVSAALGYKPHERDILFRAVETALEIDSPRALDHPHIKAAEALSTQRHIETALKVLEPLETPVDVIGYHGQTVLHRPNAEDPSQAFTLQLGDGQKLANATGVPVVYDYRRADVEAGGQGAPLAPLYHQALLVGRAPLPAVILNLGGIANITCVIDDHPANLIAADIGPANVFMDDLMLKREGIAYDENGALAATGTSDETVINSFFQNPYFRQTGPKSLDRYSFSCPSLDHLNTPDAMATLAQLTVRSVGLALEQLEQSPKSLWVAGGGARNAHLMAQLRSYLDCLVAPLDDLGFSSAFLEAEAFGYLAARHLANLPTSYPNTTGVCRPVVGGKLVHPQ